MTTHEAILSLFAYVLACLLGEPRDRAHRDVLTLACLLNLPATRAKAGAQVPSREVAREALRVVLQATPPFALEGRHQVFARLAAFLDEHAPPAPDGWQVARQEVLQEVPGVRELREETGREISLSTRLGVAGLVHRAAVTVGRHVIEGEDRASEAAAVEALRLELAERGMLAGVEGAA